MKTEDLKAIGLSDEQIQEVHKLNGLDIDGVITLRKLLKDISEKKEKSIIITSHNTAELDKLCDRFGILYNGKIVEVSKDEMKTGLEELYLNIIKGGLSKDDIS